MMQLTNTLSSPSHPLSLSSLSWHQHLYTEEHNNQIFIATLSPLPSPTSLHLYILQKSQSSLSSQSSSCPVFQKYYLQVNTDSVEGEIAKALFQNMLQFYTQYLCPQPRLHSPKICWSEHRIEFPFSYTLNSTTKSSTVCLNLHRVPCSPIVGLDQFFSSKNRMQSYNFLKQQQEEKIVKYLLNCYLVVDLGRSDYGDFQFQTYASSTTVATKNELTGNKEWSILSFTPQNLPFLQKQNYQNSSRNQEKKKQIYYFTLKRASNKQRQYRGMYVKVQEMGDEGDQINSVMVFNDCYCLVNGYKILSKVRIQQGESRIMVQVERKTYNEKKQKYFIRMTFPAISQDQSKGYQDFIFTDLRISVGIKVPQDAVQINFK